MAKLTREQAIEETNALVRSLRLLLDGGAVLPPAGRNKGGDGADLREWVLGLLRDRVETGQIVTPILRIPGGAQPPILECLKDEGNYAQFGPLGVVVTLRNESTQPIHVLTKEVYRPDPVGVGSFTDTQYSGKHGGSGRQDRTYEVVAPGETIRVSAMMAINALHEHCQSAHPPHWWGASAALPAHDNLVEIGYAFLDNGVYTVAPPPAEPEPDAGSEPPTRRRGRPPKTEATAGV